MTEKAQAIIKELSSQLEKFESWAAAKQWGKISGIGGHEGFDWWTFPINENSNFKSPEAQRWYVDDADIAALKGNVSYMANYRKAVELYLESLGWKDGKISDQGRFNNLINNPNHPYGVRFSKLFLSAHIIADLGILTKVYQFKSAVDTDLRKKGASAQDIKNWWWKDGNILDLVYAVGTTSRRKKGSDQYWQNYGSILQLRQQIFEPELKSSVKKLDPYEKLIIKSIFSWNFDHERGKGYLDRSDGAQYQVSYDTQSDKISLSDNSPQPQATENIRSLGVTLSKFSDVVIQPYVYNESHGYCRTLSFDIRDIKADKIKELPLLQYFCAVRDLDNATLDEIVANLLQAIVELPPVGEEPKGFDSIIAGYTYFKIPILKKNGYPPLAMFLDPEDGEMSMGVGSNGRMENSRLMESIVEIIEDRVKKHPKLRHFFYQNPNANDSNLQENEHNPYNHYPRLYLTKGLLDRINDYQAVSSYITQNKEPLRPVPHLENFKKAINLEENNPQPKSTYRGIGVKANFNKDGNLEIIDIFSPTERRFKNSKGEFEDLKKGQVITEIYFLKNEVEKFYKISELNSGEIATAFHSNKEVKFKISDGQEYMCDNRINKSAIFSPIPKTSPDQPDFVAFSEILEKNPVLAKETINWSINKLQLNPSTSASSASSSKLEANLGKAKS